MQYIYKGTKSWWKEAVMYQIYPRSFNDSNGDGVGDLGGIIEKLDYLKNLGIDVIWFSPIYQSPNDDNGYDISDYRNIMTEFGTMEDFDELLEGIHQRGMKLIMDLVVNHSSDEHAWFKEAQKSKDNPYRDYYIWRKPVNGKEPNDWQSFFGGSTWQFDEKTDEYYLHLFTVKQPDLNWENPKLRQEVYDLVKFWLDKGVDGFRMDVIPMISKRLEFPPMAGRPFNQVVDETYANGPRVHEFLKEFNREVLSKYDIMTVGEGIGILPEQGNDYVGSDRDELNMIFHFGHMFIDHGDGGKFDIVDIDLNTFKNVFTDWHKGLGARGWGNIYLDNHDFPRMVSRFGNDKEYWLESGKLLAMLIMSLRGTPCVYNGSEFGMTNVAFDSIDDYRDIETLNNYKIVKDQGGDLDAFLKAVHIQGRDNVRTPVQWNATKNAGFTEGTPWIKVNPNYTAINAEVAVADTNSIFHFYKKLIELRKEIPTLIYGEYEVIDNGSPKIFAYTRSLGDEKIMVLLNFSDESTVFAPTIEVESPKLIIGNYPNIEAVKGVSFLLQPWEARMYRVLNDE
jgi:oligo-1,6-glucosidase